MWQALYEELRDAGFMVVAVAEEARGAEASRPWIEQAKATYWTLIDTTHQVSELFGMVNVPESVWIDEQGRIARPAENAGSTDFFRRMNRDSKAMAQSDVDARAAARDLYLDAVRAWVRTGAHALGTKSVASKAPRLSAAVATAQAHFKLGVWLRAQGRTAEAERQFAEASRLHPDSWCIWRQAADLDYVGGAVGPEFWKRVDALGERAYYPPPDIPGFPRSVSSAG